MGEARHRVRLGEMFSEKQGHTNVLIENIGAGIAVVAHDAERQIIVALHSAFPSEGKHPGMAIKRPTLFVDAGLNRLAQQLRDLGANLQETEFFVTGGALLLEAPDVALLGAHNLENARNWFLQFNIERTTFEVGGQHERSAVFLRATETFDVTVPALGGTAC